MKRLQKAREGMTLLVFTVFFSATLFSAKQSFIVGFALAHCEIFLLAIFRYLCVQEELLFCAELKPHGYYLEHVF